MDTPAARQKTHYEAIHDDYEQHYYDPTSMAYRQRFVLDILFDGLDLNGKSVADLAAGSGHNTLALLERFPRAEVTGFDISERACEAYRRNTGRPAHGLDLTAGRDPGVQVDFAMVFGGLHHCITDLPGTFRTIAAMLRPGGILMMYEPSSDFMLDGARRIWYRFDRYFDAPTETAISHDRIARLAARHFRPLVCRYMGGPAYFLIFNSLVFRIPVGWKKVIAPPLFRIENIYDRLPGRLWYPYFIARWERTGLPADSGAAL